MSFKQLEWVGESVSCLVGVLALSKQRFWQSTMGIHLTEQILNIQILFLGWLLFILIEFGNFLAADFEYDLIGLLRLERLCGPCPLDSIDF